jgi:hypothetical protein
MVATGKVATLADVEQRVCASTIRCEGFTIKHVQHALTNVAASDDKRHLVDKVKFTYNILNCEELQ